MSNVKPIAFVLPQFHPIPENDLWWGKGFTEWTNVTKAKPLYKGHYQPQLPTDLGFYDLRLDEARQAQAAMAKEYGIEGFCYYHYWFSGKRLLNEPIDRMLHTGIPDMPFMFCWANENWTRRWDGKDQEVLIEQNYNDEDDTAHMEWLCKNVFKNSHYIKVDGKPVFSVYNHLLFPDLKKTSKLWREIAKNFGFPDLYLCVIESFNRKVNPLDYNFDAAIEFAPHRILKHRIPKTFLEKKVFKISYDKRDYGKAVEKSINRLMPSEYKLFRCVTPAWDNTARRGVNATISTGSTPKLYGKWLKTIKDKFTPYSEEENFIFINAMNEWAEGNHLEPCIKYGRAYLEATQKALK